MKIPSLKEILDLPSGPEKAILLCADGLLTDGAHHKQWYLERILEALGVDLKQVWETMQADGYDLEEGIAP